MNVFGQTLFQVIDSTHCNTENKRESASLFNIIHTFFQCILTSNIHMNCSLFWFTKAIICCTGKCS